MASSYGEIFDDPIANQTKNTFTSKNKFSKRSNYVIDRKSFKSRYVGGQPGSAEPFFRNRGQFIESFEVDPARFEAARVDTTKSMYASDLTGRYKTRFEGAADTSDSTQCSETSMYKQNYSVNRAPFEGGNYSAYKSRFWGDLNAA